jgi:hypothetical protein
MVRHKIIWSHRARIKLFKILEFYSERNLSKDYSIKLYHKIIQELKILFKQPSPGLKTELESIRGLIVDDYIIFYQYEDGKIIVHSIWDCRQNPDNIQLK